METWVIKTYDEWVEEFKPEENKNANETFLYDTYGEDMERISEVYKSSPRRIWTLQEMDGVSFIQSGSHFVNRLGYYVTEIEAPEGQNTEVYFIK